MQTGGYMTTCTVKDLDHSCDTASTYGYSRANLAAQARIWLPIAWTIGQTSTHNRWQLDIYPHNSYYSHQSVKFWRPRNHTDLHKKMAFRLHQKLGTLTQEWTSTSYVCLHVLPHWRMGCCIFWNSTAWDVCNVGHPRQGPYLLTRYNKLTNYPFAESYERWFTIYCRPSQASNTGRIPLACQSDKSSLIL